MQSLVSYRAFYIKLWAVLFAGFICTAVFSQKPLKYTQQETVTTSQATSTVPTTLPAAYIPNMFVNYNQDKTSITPKIKPFNSDGVFDSKSRRIGFALELLNNIKEEQTGEIIMQISNNTGGVLYREIFPFKIKKKARFEKDYIIANGQLQPGFYVSSLSIATNKYADTISYNFGFEPNKIVSKLTPPRDLVSYWETAKRELAATPANFSVTPRPDLDNKNCNAYEVEYKSIDKATIYGWLTVPKRSGKNPVLYKISDYQSELAPEYRRDVAVLCINTRGTGSSTENYNFSYDQLGVYKLKDRNKYVLKGIYLDALRGLDFITQFSNQMKLDTRRIVVTGSGLGAAASAVLAAIDTRPQGIVLEGPSFIGMKDMLNASEAMPSMGFPAYMFKKFYTTQGVSKEAMLNTLAYFDPVYFAPYISGAVLTGFSLHNTNVPPQCVYAFVSQLRVSKKDSYECKDCGNSLNKGFYGFKETWLKERFGQP